MRELKGKEIQFLKQQAHNLNPVVYLGKGGLSDSLVKSIDEALNCHELIKLKFIDFKSQKKELSIQIANDLKAILVAIIGNVAILYRISPNIEKRHYFQQL